MTPETFAEEIRRAVPVGLQSVVLYGSAASGDHLGARSDHNILIVLDQLGLTELNALAAPTKAWTKAGNHPPMLFTPASLRDSADVFPIELRDIHEAHRVLVGSDAVRDIKVSDANLRRQVEFELRGKLLQLHSLYLLRRGDAAAVFALLAESVSKFLILFRATLRLYQPDVPVKKLDAMNALSRHVTFEQEIFTIAHGLKTGSHEPQSDEAEALFERYLRAIENVVTAVNQQQRGAKQ